MRAHLAWLFLLLAVLVAADASAQGDSSDYQDYLSNARLFVKQQFYDDALAELDKAVDHDDGRFDAEAWFMLATVRFELCDLEGARDAAARAHTYSKDDEQLRQAAGFSAFLQEQFGVLEIKAPYAGLTARLDLELESILFDPNLKLYLSKLQASYGKKVLLPQRIGLPAGTYRINGRQVTVGPGDEVGLILTTQELNTRGTAAQLAQAELGLGTSVWFGSRVDNLQPALATQIAVSQPIGSLVVGAMLDWTPRSYATTSGQLERSAIAWALGGRVGFEIPGLEPIVIRPSLGYRFGYLPGIEVQCAKDGASFECGGSGGADLYIYANGHAHVPLAELSVLYLDRTRTTTLGVGVKAIAEQAFGFLPRQAVATYQTSGRTVSYEIVDGSRSFSATGVRILANISLSF